MSDSDVDDDYDDDGEDYDDEELIRGRRGRISCEPIEVGAELAVGLKATKGQVQKKTAYLNVNDSYVRKQRLVTRCRFTLDGYKLFFGGVRTMYLSGFSVMWLQMRTFVSSK